MPDNIDQGDADDASEHGRGALSGASAHEVTAHRNALGDMLQSLSDKGFDVDAIVEKAGVSSADVQALSHDDLITLTEYIACHHGDVLQSVAAKFPAAQGLLAAISGSKLDGLLGGFFGKRNES